MPLAERALALVGGALGPDHPTVAVLLSNVSVLYQSQGDYARAEPPLARALAIDEKALGP